METMIRTQSESELSDSFDVEESASNSSNSSLNSSSSSSTSSNDGNEEDQQADTPELAKLTNEVLSLPRGLCENVNIFKEFFSIQTWNDLSDEQRLKLKTHLPDFAQLLSANDAEVELNNTVSLLFNNELKRFGITPLERLQHNLEEGNYRPDVLKLRESIAKSKRREQRFRSCERLSQLAKQLFLSRERFLRSVYAAEPEFEGKDASERKSKKLKTSNSLWADTKICAVRARKRFYTEIEEIVEQMGLKQPISADEEDDADAPTPEMLRYEEQLRKNAFEDAATLRNGNTINDKCFYDTFFKRRSDMSYEEAMHLKQNSKRPRLNNRNFRQYLLDHKRRKVLEPTLPDFDTSDIRIRDVCSRAQMGGNFKKFFTMGKGKKQKSKSIEPPALIPIQPIDLMENTEQPANQISDTTTVNDQINEFTENQQLNEDIDAFNVMDNDIDYQQEEVETYSTCEETIPAFVIGGQNSTEENNDVTTSDAKDDQQAQFNQNFNNMPKLEPISGTQNISNVQNNSTASLQLPTKRVMAVVGTNYDGLQTELIQETHACFFSLIRDFFCATANHRMKHDELKKKIDQWLCNPITALNDWYLQVSNWSSLLASAINFLSGNFIDLPEEYVPYIELKPQYDIYQWIGAGRDSDARLSTLCTFWIQQRTASVEDNLDTSVNELINTPNQQQSQSIDIEDTTVYDSGLSPPPLPRNPTNWTVRAISADKIAEFQRQERERFENPHRAYTYRMHGYESVVGPVKGIYSQIHTTTKARGHSMLTADRPNFLTMLTLVRDATARLPNGEGTRADISELLKCSQYFNRDAAENVLQSIVSGALDRMHTEPDPCVRYDPKRKIWIYLHRNRSEEEFERLHQQYQNQGKNKKQISRKQRPKAIANKNETEFNTNTSNVLTDSSSNVVTTSNTNSIINLPALVPTNSKTIVINQPKPQNILTKGLPVPPLKYNIPSPQQKSLLKTAVTREVKSVNDNSGDTLTSIQKSQQKTTTTATSGNVANSIVIAAPAINKQFNFSMPQMKTGGNTAGAMTGITSKTPIVVATPTGLQTVHVTNASGENATAFSATVGGKKVALHKPIIINQITQGAAIKQKAQQQQQQKQQQLTVKQQNQQQSFIVPLSLGSGGNALSPTESKDNTHNIQTIFFDNGGSQQILNADGTINSGSGQQQTKNVIRLVPAAGVKQLITASPIVTKVTQQQQQQQQLQQQQARKQPIQIIGQRLVTNNLANVRTPVQPKTVTVIHSPTGSSTSAQTTGTASNSSGGGTAILKMSPQAFASLQQKQAQQILLKQATPTSTRQRVVVGNTAIIAQPTQLAGKSVTMEKAGAATQKVITTTPTANKIQSINTTNLTPQQQRVLLQNIKQQQVQLKPVQVTTNATSIQDIQTQGQQSPCSQTVTILSQPRASTPAPKQAGKTVTVVMSQPQVITRLIKAATPTTTNAPTQPQQQVTKQEQQIGVKTVSGDVPIAKVFSTSSGQIISLESLLQKQAGNTIKSVNNSTTKLTQASNVIQLTPTGQQSGAPQFAVVSSQPRNIISLGTPTRIVTTQTTANTILTSPINVTTAKSKDSPKVTQIPAGAVKVVSPSGQQQTIAVSQLTNAKILGKTNVTISTAQTSGNNTAQLTTTNTSTGATSNLNIATLQGKHVVFTAAKPTTNVKNLTAINANQTAQLQNANVIIGGQTVKLQTNQINKSTTQPHMQTIILGNQIVRLPKIAQQVAKTVQQKAAGMTVTTTVANTNTPTIVVNSSNSATTLKSAATTTTTTTINTTTATTMTTKAITTNLPKTLVLGSTGQTIRLQPTSTLATTTTNVANKSAGNANVSHQQTSLIGKTTPANRLVLSVQGGGHVILSPNFQGNTVNLKSLQNMKLVSIAQNSANNKDNQQQDKLLTIQTPKLAINQPTIIKSAGNSNG